MNPNDGPFEVRMRVIAERVRIPERFADAETYRNVAMRAAVFR